MTDTHAAAHPAGALYGGALELCGAPPGAVAGGAPGGPAADEGSAAQKAKARVVAGLVNAWAAVAPRQAAPLQARAAAGDLAGAAAGLLALMPPPGEVVRGPPAKVEGYCRALAGALNAEFGGRPLFDLGLPAAGLCVQLREGVAGVAAGLQAELAEVLAGVRAAVGRLEALAGPLAAARAAAEAAADDAAAAAAAALEAERARQLGVLAGLVKAAVGAEGEAAAALAGPAGPGGPALAGALADVALEPTDFARVLADAMRDIGRGAALAARVDEALAAIGRSLADFQAAGRAEVEAAAGDGRPAALAEAAAVLRDVFAAPAAPAAPAVIKGGGEDGPAVTGGALPSSEDLDKRIAARKKSREDALRAFIRRYHQLVAALAAAIDGAGRAMARKGYPSTPALSEVLAAMEAFGIAAEAGPGAPAMLFERQLLGMVPEGERGTARSVRETFLGAAARVDAALARLKADPAYGAAGAELDALGGAVAAFSRLVDSAAGVAGGYEGGDGPVEVDLTDLPAVDVSIRSAIRAFRYFFFAAEIRANFKTAAKEVVHYGDGYEEMLTKAAKSRLESLRASYKAYLESAEGRALSPDAVRAVRNEFKCKRDLLEAVLVIEKYLKAFTAAVTADPEAVKDLARSLKGVPMNDRWYSPAAGTSLAEAFEAFGAAELGGNPAEHYYQRLANTGRAPADVSAGVPIGGARAKAATDGVKDAIGNFTALKNIINLFFRIGDKFGSAHLYKSAGMSPEKVSNALRKYLQCSAFTNLAPAVAVPAGPAAAPAPVAPEGFDASPATVLPAVVAAVQRAAARAAQLAADPNYADADWVRVVLPLVAAVRDNANAILNTDFAAERAAVDAAIAAVNALPPAAAAPDVPAADAPGLVGALLGAAGAAPAGLPAAGVVYRNLGELRARVAQLSASPPTPVAPAAAAPALPAGLARFQPVGRTETLRLTTVGEASGIFAEDNLFVYAIQAMCGKVFTAIGVGNLLEKPSPLFTSMPTRAIMGGAADGAAAFEGGAVEVDPAAAPTIYKVLRLGEFFRQLLEFNEGDPAMSQIALLPDAEGVFGGLIQALFLQIDIATSQAGTYSDREVALLLAELQGIHRKFAGEPDPAAAACREFIAEVNRRIGVVSRSQYRKTLDLYYEGVDNDATAYGQVATRSRTNYAYLPGEGEPDVGSGASPLADVGDLGDDEASAAAAAGAAGPAGRPRIDRYPLVANFRRKLDSLFAAIPADALGSFDITRQLGDARRALAAAAPGAGRFAAAADLIRSGRAGPAAVISGQDSSVAVLFHETVVTGLAVLGGLHRALAGFAARFNPAAGQPAAGAAEHLQWVLDAHAAYPGLVGFAATAAGGIRVDFTAVRSLAESLIADVRQYLNGFRAVLPNALIEQYMGTAAAGAAGPPAGTLLYFEQALVRDLFTAPRRTSRAAAPGDDSSLDRAVEVFAAATANGAVTVAMVIAAVNAVGAGAGNAAALGALGQILTAGGQANSGFISRNPGNPAALPTYSMPSGGSPLAQGSLIYRFNDLVGKYIAAFFDSGSGKIYRDLIESVGGGTYGPQVASSQGGVTLTAAGAFSIAANAPGSAAETPLSPGLCEVLRRLLTERDPRSQVPLRTAASLSEVQRYTQTRLSDLLPVFIDQFRGLVSSGELLKGLAADLGVAVPNVIAAVDRVTEGCFALIDAATTVLAQVGGEVNYLEMADNALANYRAANGGRDPFTPLSTITALLGGNAVAVRRIVTPAATGANAKLLRGLRGALTGAPGSGLGTAPALGAIVAAFNTVSGSSVDAAGFKAFGDRAADAVRFAALLNAATLGAGAAAYAGRVPATAPLQAAEASGGRIGAIVQLTQRSDQRTALRAVAGRLGAAGNAPVGVNPGVGQPNPLLGVGPGNVFVARDVERVGVVVDLNMMPINVHALMRGIPFANLFNYSYTFQQYAAMFHGLFASDVDAGARRFLAGQNDSAAVRAMGLQLLFKPYTGLDTAGNGAARSAAMLALGQRRLDEGAGVRFVSDQLMGKALAGTALLAAGAAGAGGAFAVDITAGREAPGGPRAGPQRVNVPFNNNGAAIAAALPAAFASRFDTRLVRHLVLITNAQRILARKLEDEMTRTESVLPKGFQILNPALTDFGYTGAVPQEGNNRGYYYADRYEAATDRRYFITD